MTRTRPSALILTVLAAVSLPARATVSVSPQTPTFRAGAHMVSVYATVVDQGGRLITDLNRDDFDVFDNGVRQNVSVFANDLQPITIVVMLDRSGSMEKNFGLVQRGAEQFVSHLLPADKARIGSFSTGIQIDPVEFTSDRTALLGILHSDLLKPGPTPLWNAADLAMTALREQIGRRVVLLFTDGKDNAEGASVGVETIRHRAQVEEIMLYAIGLSDGCAPQPSSFIARVVPVMYQRRGGRGLPPVGLPGRGGPLPGRNPGGIAGIPRGNLPAAEHSSDDPCASEKPDPDLRMLADDNGGGYFELHSTDDLGMTFARVALELHHQFLLAFTPAVLDGATHTLDVRVRQPNMTVRARKSYVATPEK